MARPVVVLYAKARSVYSGIRGLDIWDERRDARLSPGLGAIVAHPPCRAWGRYAHRAKATEQERDLAFHALAMVRAWGGVLEHPASSKFWKAAVLPRPGERPDRYGGYTIQVNQVDWGHRAVKPTWLYIVGVPVHRLPARPGPGTPVTTVERMWRGEREATPLPFARWLVDLASSAVAPIFWG